jgi:hypothetical protein
MSFLDAPACILFIVPALVQTQADLTGVHLLRNARPTPRAPPGLGSQGLSGAVEKHDRPPNRVRSSRIAYRPAGSGAAEAGLANFAASIRTLGCTALSSVVDRPSVHVTVH